MKADFANLRIVPPVPTPLRNDFSIDKPAVQRIARHLETGGIDAAFILGSTGELASLSRERRLEMIACSCSAYTIPVLVGIGDSCLENSLELARAAADAGAAAVVLHAPPYYEISTREMCAYLDLILPRLTLPVYLYNMPWLTGYSFDRETIRHAIAHPGVVGFKDSSGRMDCLETILEECAPRPELQILAGNEFLFLKALRAGAHGVVGGGGNLYPKLFRELMDAWLSGEMEIAAACQERISKLGKQLFDLNGTPGSGFATIKAGLAALGLCEATMAPPLATCEPEVCDAIAAILRPSAAA